jgi:hypothetical protein
MIVSHKYKFIFIHINKCAGTSITLALASYLDDKDIVLGCTKEGKKLSKEWKKQGKLWKHISAREAKVILGDDTWNSYFKFTFVRNPWDLIVSNYHWLLKHPGNNPQGIGAKVTKLKSFHDYVFSPYLRKINCTDQITDENGEIIVDLVCKYEKLQLDFAYACGKAGLPNIELPHQNKTNHSDFREFYNNETQKIIEKAFQKDIKAFNYSF